MAVKSQQSMDAETSEPPRVSEENSQEAPLPEQSPDEEQTPTRVSAADTDDDSREAVQDTAPADASEARDEDSDTDTESKPHEAQETQETPDADTQESDKQETQAVTDAKQDEPLPPLPDTPQEAEEPPAPRPRSNTLASTTTSVTDNPPLLSGVLVISSLQNLLNSKEAKRNPTLKAGISEALDALKNPARYPLEPKMIWEPLKFACGSRNNRLMTAALDSISKLVSQAGFGCSANPFAAQSPAVMSPQTADGPSPFKKVSPEFADELVDTVCSCFVESPSASTATSTSDGDNVNLHLLSAILTLVLSSNLPIHQASLLKCVRTVYNIFLLSKSPQVHLVAQGSLGQIINSIFSRVQSSSELRRNSTILESTPTTPQLGNDSPEPVSVGSSKNNVDVVSANDDTEPVNGHSHSEEASISEEQDPTATKPAVNGEDSNVLDEKQEETTSSEDNISPLDSKDDEKAANGSYKKPYLPKATRKVTLRELEARRSFDGVSEKDPGPIHSLQELYAKDAFLIFRAFCKLCMKPFTTESERDLKSHPMRSKLLSLHLILNILHNHPSVFVDPNVIIHSNANREQTQFTQAIKQYLCLSLSRNVASPVLAVFELVCEIFWRTVSILRVQLKEEIELFLTENFLPILTMRHSTSYQKSVLLNILMRMCHDPQTLVEIYLNYDCDQQSMENLYENIINTISKLGTSPPLTSHGSNTANEKDKALPPDSLANAFPFPMPQLPAITHFGQDSTQHFTIDEKLYRKSIEAIVFTLRSLVTWAGKVANSSGVPGSPDPQMDSVSVVSSGEGRNDEATTEGGHSYSGSISSRMATPDHAFKDDPGRIGNAKQQKTSLLEGIRLFNYKPKQGLQYFLDTGFIRSKDPKDIAEFFHRTTHLDKTVLGEFMGGADQFNIDVMHAFIDQLNFADTTFVDALRRFLQTFRLPGEAQVIDRFMLKFAERYSNGNPNAFRNADTAYVLAYSTIMLNTDAHNPNNKARRMTKEEFFKNNRGIDDDHDLPEELMSSIYDEIQTNEIKIRDEVEMVAGPQLPSGSRFGGVLAGVGRDYQREAYALHSEGLANKTEALFRNMLRKQRRGISRPADTFYAASHYEHAKPMFEVIWMPVLTAISSPLQHSSDIDLIHLALEGFRQAIKLSCLFDLDLQRNAFITTLAKFTFLNNLSEMTAKNVEAIKTLLELAQVNGNYLKESWKEVLSCVSQLERFELITKGVDSRALPELGRLPNSNSDKNLRIPNTQKHRHSKPTDEVASETLSSQIILGSERLFSSSPTLSGTAIVEFVQGLSDVSWDEIQSSGLAEHPRTFCLQKVVEISEYNMERIRLEWSAIWAILGEHFNKVTCHPNSNVSKFALDSLRQLASRFFNIEELTGFKFQKEFLKPFEHAMKHNKDVDIRIMVLDCFNYMLLSKVDNFRSGWCTTLGVLSAASRSDQEKIAIQAFDLVKQIDKDHLPKLIVNNAFADLCVCITDFCKISKYQKISLHAIEMLKSLVTQILSISECPLTSSDPKERNDAAKDYWYPLLFGHYDVIMNGEDLEVRKRALDYLFETLKKHGTSFTPDFWDIISTTVLFPMFSILRTQPDAAHMQTHENLTVWLFTTMIQALRVLVDLFTFHFDVLSRKMEQLLDLLYGCICQENDTLSRIGTSCMQQFVENNIDKFTPDHWERLVDTFVRLFRTTLATQLFSEELFAPVELGGGDANEPTNTSGVITPIPIESSDPPMPPAGSRPKPVVEAERKRIFRQIFAKCLLQLLLIDTVREMLQNNAVYQSIPATELLKLTSAIDESYSLAKKFNADKALRNRLYEVGFMKQPPNLLNQESNSAATLVSVVLRMYVDTRTDYIAKRTETLDTLLPLSDDIISGFLVLNPERQARNIAAWTPVVSEVLHSFKLLSDDDLKNNIHLVYSLSISLLGRDLHSSIRENLQALLHRIGELAIYPKQSLDEKQQQSS